MTSCPGGGRIGFCAYAHHGTNPTCMRWFFKTLCLHLISVKLQKLVTQSAQSLLFPS